MQVENITCKNNTNLQSLVPSLSVAQQYSFLLTPVTVHGSSFVTTFGAEL
jgi:hypothetical protein